jgi:5-methylcytosine-specific restriction endonuclease McrA
MKTQIRIPQLERLIVLNKYGCKCAYCGNVLTLATLKLDPTPDSIYPSCMRCKRRKGSKSIEQFRLHISVVHKQLQYLNSKYSLCKDYGMVADVSNYILFHFEKYKQ